MKISLFVKNEDVRHPSTIIKVLCTFRRFIRIGKTAALFIRSPFTFDSADLLLPMTLTAMMAN